MSPPSARSRSRAVDACLRSVVTTALFALGACDARSEAPATNAERRPNVLVVLADQHNASALACAGNEAISTPALDRLAREGARFTNAFCNTPQCAPSRYTIWTGRYAKSHGLRANRVLERLEEVTIGEVLKEAGYATASIGKHHLTRSPERHGFDTVVELDDFEAWRKAAGVDHWNRAGKWLGLGAMHGHVGRTSVPNEQHRDGWFTDRALEFVREHRDEPFCLWLSFYGPHTPIVVSSPWSESVSADDMQLAPTVAAAGDPEHRLLAQARAGFADFTEEDHRKVQALYFSFVAQLDFNVGRVLDELDALGLADDTVVVYAGDHGDMQTAFGLWGKFLFQYDPALRVPLIVRAPGARAGLVTDELAELVDLAPTLLDLVGVAAPDAMQGRSLAPLLTGRPFEPRLHAFAEAGMPGTDPGRSVMARSRTHKYVWNENSGAPHVQLFDLVQDPWETTNVVARSEYATVRDELRAALEAWERSTEEAPLREPADR